LTVAPRLPDFVIIGAAKAGTTSIYAILDQHPGIFMPEVKEPEFFARDDRYSEGIAAYGARFAAAGPDQVVGEASTIYSLTPHFPDTPARLKTHIPQAKIIYVLREPVGRAYSFYTQLVKNYQNVTGDLAVHRSFEEMIDPALHTKAAPRDKILSPANAHMPDTPELCLAGSEYVQQIDSYLTHFAREQCLFLKFEDFVKDRAATLRRITDFIEVAPLDAAVFDNEHSTQNVSAAHFEDLSRQMGVAQARAKAGPLWGLRKLVPAPLRDALKARLRGAGAEAVRPAPMTAETRTKLATRFAAQLPALEARTGLTFDEWDLPRPAAADPGV